MSPLSYIESVLVELLGLFVDDGTYALAILTWLGVAWFVLPRLPMAGPWAGVVLFAGLAGVLLESALRRARR